MGTGELLTKEIVVHEFEKGPNEKVICKLSPYKGSDYFSAWVFYDKDDDWRPGAKGLTINLEALDDLAEGVEKVRAKVRELLGVGVV